MKPDWKDAPSWAKWLAMDSSGQWFWHEFRPTTSRTEWDSARLIALAHVPAERWDETLEERPQ